MGHPLDILDATDDEPEITDAPETDEAEQAEPEEDAEDDGSETTGDTDAAPPAATPEDPKSIPVGALKDERTKRQAAEREAEERKREAEELRQRIAALEAGRQAPPQPPQQRPHIPVDPQLQALVYQTKLEQSRFLAERDFGADEVKEAFAFFDRPENQSLTLQFQGAPSPFHAAVDFHRQLKTAREIGDPQSYRDKLKAELRAEWEAEQAQGAAPSPAKPRPPVSLATAPAAGRAAPVAPGNVLDHVLDP